MPLLSEHLFEISEQARFDFLDGRVTPDEILHAAAVQGLGHWIASQQSTEVLIDYSRFPGDCCTIASIVLGARVNAARILGAATTFIPGGFKLIDDYDPDLPLLNVFHAVVGVGETDLGEDTILCITGGQFPNMPNRSYVGPLRNPWTRTPGESIVPVRLPQATLATASAD